MVEGIEFLEHTADAYLKVWGKSLEEMFERAGIGFYEVMTDTSKVKCKVKKEVEVEGYDLQNLLLRWLEELLFLFDSEGFIAAKIEVDKLTTKPPKLHAILCGERFDPKKHDVRVAVKAATYSDMEIWRENDLWYATYVLDI